ncbi:MAG TPA: OsmC family protein [Candidatus Eisenbacteria bacterium]|jgi:putative redox protein|nr:OsmC family protein [Candidatus Eisenbacteria bacterium]
MVRGSLRWSNDPDRPHQFVGVTGSGHCVNFDQAAAGTAPSPIETLALALAACSGFDVITILRKKRQQVTGYEVRVEAEQRVGPPAVFTGIRLTHVVRGHAIDPQAVAQAVELSKEKYCSIGAMLAPTVPIDHTLEVLEDAFGRPDASLTRSAGATAH